jgi:hypothetical protein
MSEASGLVVGDLRLATVVGVVANGVRVLQPRGRVDVEESAPDFCPAVCMTNSSFCWTVIAR